MQLGPRPVFTPFPPTTQSLGRPVAQLSRDPVRFQVLLSFVIPQVTTKANLASHLVWGLAVHSTRLFPVGGRQGCSWVLLEVLLRGPVVLQLLLDALKLSLQVSVARGHRIRLSFTTLQAGSRLNGGSLGAGSGLSACCADGLQVHACSVGAQPRPGACEVPGKEQTGVGDPG